MSTDLFFLDPRQLDRMERVPIMMAQNDYTRTMLHNIAHGIVSESCKRNGSRRYAANVWRRSGATKRTDKRGPNLMAQTFWIRAGDIWYNIFTDQYADVLADECDGSARYRFSKLPWGSKHMG